MRSPLRKSLLGLDETLVRLRAMVKGSKWRFVILCKRLRPLGMKQQDDEQGRAAAGIACL